MESDEDSDLFVQMNDIENMKKKALPAKPKSVKSKKSKINLIIGDREVQSFKDSLSLLRDFHREIDRGIGFYHIETKRKIQIDLARIEKAEQNIKDNIEKIELSDKYKQLYEELLSRYANISYKLDSLLKLLTPENTPINNCLTRCLSPKT